MSARPRGALLLFLALSWAALEVAGQGETFKGYATAYTCERMLGMGRFRPKPASSAQHPAPPADGDAQSRGRAAGRALEPAAYRSPPGLAAGGSCRHRRLPTTLPLTKFRRARREEQPVCRRVQRLPVRPAVALL